MTFSGETITPVPMDWIQMECIPLPESPYPACLVFWNPSEQVILGEGAEAILALVEQAQQQGYINSPTLSHFEITQPLSQPSELAAILAQFYWVIPQPVLSPHAISDIATGSVH